MSEIERRLREYAHADDNVLTLAEEAADQIAALTARCEALEIALTPRRWTAVMSRVWHQNLPNTDAAFMALREVALVGQQPDADAGSPK